MDLLAIQEALGHAWVATTMGYVHVHATHVEDAWIAGQERAAMQLEGPGQVSGFLDGCCRTLKMSVAASLPVSVCMMWWPRPAGPGGAGVQGVAGTLSLSR